MNKFFCQVFLWLTLFLPGLSLAAHPEPSPQHTPIVANVTDILPTVTPTPLFPDLLPNIVVAPFRSEPGELAYLRGLPLFRLQSTHDISGRDRAELLERRLEKLVPGDDPIDVEIKRSKDGIFLSCRDTTLIGVHDADVEAAQTTPEALSIRWSQVLDQSLERTRQEQGSEFFKHALAITGLSVLLWLLADRFLRRLTLRYLQTSGLSIRLLHALLWTTFIFWQFPATRTFALAVERYGVRPLMTFLLVVISAFFCYYLLGRGIEHYFRQHELVGEKAHFNKPRWRQRLHMTRQVTSAVTSTVLVMLAVVIFFSLLDVNLGALLAGASFLGVGLGLAAQNILKDWISGVNIVLEDQFGDGDIIATDGFEGVVERFTLRITQLRDMSGSLITIPNSRIQSVRNQSNVWSQVDLSVGVSYRADTRKALEILAQVARTLAIDWPERLQGEPVVLGVEELGPYSLRLRMLQRTAPQQQFSVRRELLLRVKEAFAREGIEIPIQEMRLNQDKASLEPAHPKKKN